VLRKSGINRQRQTVARAGTTMSVALDMARARGPATDEAFRNEYLHALRLIERLHRLLLDVIKDEFDRLGGSEVNSVQALLLYNMGDSELTAGELKTRGYYLGSNVSYNLKKLVEMGYLHYKRSETDRRSVRVSLTPKGLQAREVIQKLYQRQLGSVEAVGQVSLEEFKGLNKALVRLERFWTDQIRYRL
jgi:DNA-binding MarR family transcriptional regulator